LNLNLYNRKNIHCLPLLFVHQSIKYSKRDLYIIFILKYLIINKDIKNFNEFIIFFKAISSTKFKITERFGENCYYIHFIFKKKKIFFSMPIEK